MKRLSSVLIAALLGTIALCGDAWRTYKSPDGFYSVAFPGKPFTDKKKQEIKGYQVPMDIAFFGKSDSGYGVIRMHLGSAIPGMRGKEEEIMTLGLNGFTQGKGYRVFSQDTFRMDGHPGIHTVLHKNGIEEQVYIIGKDGQVIFIVAAGKPGRTVTPTTKKFIASFKLH